MIHLIFERICVKPKVRRRKNFGLVWFDSVFHVWLGLNLVRFFLFQTYKTKIEHVGFLKILIGLINFFYGLIFSVTFFLVFLI
jgi:hypothetical protein